MAGIRTRNNFDSLGLSFEWSEIRPGGRHACPDTSNWITELNKLKIRTRRPSEVRSADLLGLLLPAWTVLDFSGFVLGIIGVANDYGLGIRQGLYKMRDPLLLG